MTIISASVVIIFPFHAANLSNFPVAVESINKEKKATSLMSWLLLRENEEEKDKNEVA